MDPESEIEIRKQIEQRHLQVVGWYHSHPNFPPHPSIRDIENQNAYQKLFVDEEHRKEPFVGAIFGTFDPRMPTSESIVSWFYVDSVESKGQPYNLTPAIIADPEVGPAASSTMAQLVKFYSTFPDRTHFDERWRFALSDQQRQALAEAKEAIQPLPAMAFVAPTVAEQLQPPASAPMEAQDAPVRKPEAAPGALAALAQSAQVTRLQKTLDSLRCKLPKEMSEDDSTFFLDNLELSIESCWFSSPISKGEIHTC